MFKVVYLLCFLVRQRVRIYRTGHCPEIRGLHEWRRVVLAAQVVAESKLCTESRRNHLF